MGVVIHLHIAQAQGLCGFRRRGAAQDRPDPGDHFHHGEGLGQIVVSPQVQTQNLVIFCALGGGHDDGDPFRGSGGAQLFQDLDAVGAGEHDVQRDELGRLPRQGGEQAIRVAETLGLKPGGPQGIDHQLADAAVVFYTINHEISSHLCKVSFVMIPSYNRNVRFSTVFCKISVNSGTEMARRCVFGTYYRQDQKGENEHVCYEFG